jgi:hypothetical protein
VVSIGSLRHSLPSFVAEATNDHAVNSAHKALNPQCRHSSALTEIHTWVGRQEERGAGVESLID